MNKTDELDIRRACLQSAIDHGNGVEGETYRDFANAWLPHAADLIAAARLLQELTCTAQAGYDGAGIPGVTLGQLDRASALLSRLESP